MLLFQHLIIFFNGKISLQIICSLDDWFITPNDVDTISTAYLSWPHSPTTATAWFSLPSMHIYLFLKQMKMNFLNFSELSRHIKHQKTLCPRTPYSAMSFFQTSSPKLSIATKEKEKKRGCIRHRDSDHNYVIHFLHWRSFILAVTYMQRIHTV